MYDVYKIIICDCDKGNKKKKSEFSQFCVYLQLDQGEYLIQPGGVYV